MVLHLVLFAVKWGFICHCRYWATDHYTTLTVCTHGCELYNYTVAKMNSIAIYKSYHDLFNITPTADIKTVSTFIYVYIYILYICI